MRFSFRLWDKNNKKMLDKFNLNMLQNPPESVVIMQSSGLFDKYGKEIFEGDILKDGEDIGMVGWNENGGGFVLSLEYYTQLFSVVNCRLYEIVGNIYENPELLKENK